MVSEEQVSFEWHDEQIRKRARIPNSCVACRKKKIKCDKGKPACLQCIKRHGAAGCAYEEFPWKFNGIATPASPEVSTVLEKLKAIEATLVNKDAHSLPISINDYNPSETVNLQNYVPFMVPLILRKHRVEYSGVMSSMHNIKNDKHLKVVWMYMWRSFEKAMAHMSPNTPPTDANGDTPRFLRDMRLLLARLWVLKKQKTALKAEMKLILNSNSEVNSLIASRLPPRATIKTLLDRFFDRFYPMYPVFDRAVYARQLESTIGPLSSSGPVTIIKETHSGSFAVGLLFLQLALARMTIQPEEFDTIPELNPMDKVNSGVLLAMARRVVSDSHLLRKNQCLLAIQYLIILKVYFQYCPEDDDVSDETNSRTLLGFIFTIAKSMGMHCEPQIERGKLGGDAKDAVAFMYVRRKIWYTILDMDATQAVTTGVKPFCHNEALYDTPLPRSSVQSDELEEWVVKDYALVYRKTLLLRKVAMSLFMRRERPTLRVVMEIMSELWTFLVEDVGNLKEILKDDSLKWYGKLKMLSYLFEIINLSMGLKVRVLRHFQDKGNNDMSYKMLDASIVLLMKVLNSAMNVCYNIRTYVGVASAPLLRPVVFGGIMQSSMLIGSLLSQTSQCFKLLGECNRDRSQLFTAFNNALIVQMERALQLLRLLNDGYYNSEKHIHALTYLLQVLKDPLFTFDKAVEDITYSEDQKNRSCLFHTLQKDEIPTSNMLLSLLDGEIAHLTTNLISTIPDIIKPLDNSHYTDLNMECPPKVNAIYDPVRDQSFASAASSPPQTRLQHEGTDLDLGTLFGEKNLLWKKPPAVFLTPNDIVGGLMSPTTDSMVTGSDAFTDLMDIFSDDQTGFLNTVLPNRFTGTFDSDQMREIFGDATTYGGDAGLNFHDNLYDTDLASSSL